MHISSLSLSLSLWSQTRQACSSVSSFTLYFLSLMCCRRDSMPPFNNKFHFGLFRSSPTLAWLVRQCWIATQKEKQKKQKRERERGERRSEGEDLFLRLCDLNNVGLKDFTQITLLSILKHPWKHKILALTIFIWFLHILKKYSFNSSMYTKRCYRDILSRLMQLISHFWKTWTSKTW